MDDSPVSDDEDDVNLSKLFKKAAKQVSHINDKDDMTDTVVNKPVKGKSPKKNDKVKRTPERKRKNEDDNEREGNFFYLQLHQCIYMHYDYHVYPWKPRTEQLSQILDMNYKVYNYAGKRAKGKDTNMISGIQKHGKSHVRSFFFSSFFGLIEVAKLFCKEVTA